MKVKDFIKKLETFDQEKEIRVSCDEEWNTIFTEVEVQQDGYTDNIVIFGLSGSEEDIEALLKNKGKDKK